MKINEKFGNVILWGLRWGALVILAGVIGYMLTLSLSRRVFRLGFLCVALMAIPLIGLQDTTEKEHSAGSTILRFLAFVVICTVMCMFFRSRTG